MGIDMLAIGARRWRGKAVGGVGPLMRLGDRGDLFPEQFAGGPIEREQFELERRQPALLGLIERRGGGYKHLLAPDDGGRILATRRARPSI